MSTNISSDTKIEISTINFRSPVTILCFQKMTLSRFVLSCTFWSSVLSSRIQPRGRLSFHFEVPLVWSWPEIFITVINSLIGFWILQLIPFVYSYSIWHCAMFQWLLVYCSCFLFFGILSWWQKVYNFVELYTTFEDPHCQKFYFPESGKWQLRSNAS